jgi:nucleoside-diphosphate-sugar epimerase
MLLWPFLLIRFGRTLMPN